MSTAAAPHLAHSAVAGTTKVEVEEPATGEKLLLAALAACDKVEEERLVVACRLAALNQLGISWCQRDDMAKAREHLEKALTTYFTLGEGHEAAVLEHLVTPSPCGVEGGRAGRAWGCWSPTPTTTWPRCTASSATPASPPSSATRLPWRWQGGTWRRGSCPYAGRTVRARRRWWPSLSAGRWRPAAAWPGSRGRNFDPEGRKVQGEWEREEREAVGKCRGTMDRLAAKYGLALLESSWRQVEEKVEEVGKVGDVAVESLEFEGLELWEQLPSGGYESNPGLPLRPVFGTVSRFWENYGPGGTL